MISAQAMSETPPEVLERLNNDYPGLDTHKVILIDISAQQLSLLIDGVVTQRYSVSTSKYGIGSESGSNKTPLGAHLVKRRYGTDAPTLSIFKGRKNTGKIAALQPEPKATGDDFVTTRILWLTGLDEGQNLGSGVDSYKRYIYIHGTHEEGLIGQPASHGCIRMRNDDVIELFDQVPVSTPVYISQELTIESESS